MQTTEVMITSRLALSSCPACTASYTAIDSVFVLPGMLPATISVAPNSPIERANASSVPPSTPRQASGKVTRRNTPNGPMPSTLAACSSCVSTVSNAARAPFSTSGNATTAAAITAACQVKIRLMPKLCCSHAPAADEHQQVVAQHGRRHHHRQGQQRVQQLAPGKAAARQQVAERDAQHQVDRRG